MKAPDVLAENLSVSCITVKNLKANESNRYPYCVFVCFLSLQKYPDEGLTSVIKNVFDFDSYNKELQEVLITTMQKHGIPIGATGDSIQLAKE